MFAAQRLTVNQIFAMCYLFVVVANGIRAVVHVTFVAVDCCRCCCRCCPYCYCCHCWALAIAALTAVVLLTTRSLQCNLHRSTANPRRSACMVAGVARTFKLLSIPPEIHCLDRHHFALSGAAPAELLQFLFMRRRE